MIDYVLGLKIVNLDLFKAAAVSNVQSSAAIFFKLGLTQSYNAWNGICRRVISSATPNTAYIIYRFQRI